MIYFILCILALFQVEAKPPVKIPKKFKKQFTLNGRIPVSRWYRDDSYSSSKPRVYTTEEVDKFIVQAQNKERKYYKETDDYLYSALETYLEHIEGKEVAIIGSVIPWYEAIVLSYGGKPTTIEYNRIISKDPRLTVLTVNEYKLNPKKFDAVLSISSFEHDGLGRYGDPINPNGDLRAMKETLSMLKDDGILILAVPIGPDRLWWNVHRVYGPIRFPMLCKGWKKIDSFGFKKSDFTNPAHKRGLYQPIFVLRPQ